MVPELIERIIRREGSLYTDRKSDRGGPTKFGITIPTLSRFLGYEATAADIQRLDVGTARAVYWQLFVRGPGFDVITFEPLLEQLVDYGVHSGTGASTRALQRILGVKVDGVFGSKTKQALSERDPGDVAARLWDARLVFMAKIVEADVRAKTGRLDTDAENIEGWINRMLSINPRRIA